MALLELMFATAILGIALITLGIAMGRCVRGLSDSDHVNGAVRVADNRLAEWRAAASGPDGIHTGVFEGRQADGPQQFTWRHEIETTQDAGIFKSTLTVQWDHQERIFVSLVSQTSTFQK